MGQRRSELLFHSFLYILKLLFSFFLCVSFSIPCFYKSHQAATLLRQANKGKSFLLPLSSSSNNNKNSNWLTSSLLLSPSLVCHCRCLLSSSSESIIQLCGNLVSIVYNHNNNNNRIDQRYSAQQLLG